MTKAVNVARLLDDIDIGALDSSAQRSLAQRYNAWAREYNVTPKVTKKVASPVKGIKFTPIATQKEKSVPKLDLEAIIKRAVAEMMTSVDVEPTPIRAPRTTPARTTRKAKPKANTFYEDVIVGGYAKRAEAKPYKCESPKCYKYGRRFTATGWKGNGTTQGHVQLAARFHPKGR